MATITGYTAARMLEIENSTIVDGDIVGNDLILKRRDLATINAGNVRGPTGAPGVSAEDLENQLTQINGLLGSHMPVGSIVDYIGTVAPTGWLAMAGQTISNGQGLYPNLWAVLPAGMKSGSNIILPNTQGRVTVGLSGVDTDFNQIAETGGAKTHVLTVGELATHAHSIDHNHPAVNSGHTGQDHVHDMSHGHPATTSGGGTPHAHDSGDLVTGTESAQHYHTSGNGTFATAEGVASNTAYQDGGLNNHTVPGVWGNTSYQVGSHVHDVSGWTAYEGSHYHSTSTPAISGTTGGMSSNHYHSVDIDPYTGSSNNIGLSQAHNNMQPYIVFLKMIKAI